MNRRGMTLLELVVGLTVTGLVLSAGYAAFSSVTDHHARAEAATSAVSRAAAARRTLSRWLEGARLTVEDGGPPFQGLDGFHDGLPDDELTFLTVTGGHPGVMETVLRLYVDRDSATPERGLSAELSEWRGTTLRRIEVEPAAISLDFRYFTRMLGHGEWLASWISSTVLPAGVELRLGAVKGDSLPALLRLPVAVPLGSRR
jgi:prepilin-type N-terminal cleavage/methylation domain-containing protein